MWISLQKQISPDMYASSTFWKKMKTKNPIFILNDNWGMGELESALPKPLEVAKLSYSMPTILTENKNPTFNLIYHCETKDLESVIPKPLEDAKLSY